jgi:dienelactone hydrolase
MCAALTMAGTLTFSASEISVEPVWEERRFTTSRAARTIPGVLWLPIQAEPVAALVLVQHGGSGSKHDPSVLESASALVSAGMAVAAIDGPIHGERRQAPADKAALLAEFIAYWRETPQIEDFAQDWIHVLNGLLGLLVLRSARVGWLGLSMGTAYGLEVLARQPAIEAAVIGKWSSQYLHGSALAAAAEQVSASVLFIQHWDDEIFDRCGTLELFDRIAAADKRLYVYPGSHFGRSREELDASLAHLTRLVRPRNGLPRRYEL